MSAIRPLPELAAAAPETVASPLAPRGDMTRTIADSITASGRGAGEITTAVTIGSRGGEVITALRAGLPRLRRVVVLEPEPECWANLIAGAGGSTGEVQVWAMPWTPGDEPDTPERALLRWWVAQRCELERTIWITDPKIAPRHHAVGTRLSTAAHDLLWDGAARLREALAAASIAPPSQLVEASAWADLCFEQGVMHTALLWYLTIERHAPSPRLASRLAVTWARLGAPGRAREWLARSDVAPGDRSAADHDFAAASAELSASAAAILALNLAHLRSEWPALADAVADAGSLDGEVVWCELPWRLRGSGDRFTVQRLEYPLVVANEGGRWRACNAPEHPLALRAQLDPRTPLGRLHACIGQLSNYAALVGVTGNRVTSETPNWRQSVVAVESAPSVLALLCAAIDLREVLRRDRIDWVDVGSGAEVRAVEWYRRHPRRPLPRVRAACSRALAEGFAALETERAAARDAHARALHDAYPGDEGGRTLARLEAGAPLRIWTWTSIHTTVLQHVARGLMAGFAEHGHQTEILIEQDVAEQLEGAEIVGSLDRARPDLVVFLDHIRPEYGALVPPGLPVVAWLLDELPGLAVAKTIARLGPNDLAFAWSMPLRDHYLRLGYPHCVDLPFAVDPAVYFHEPEIVAEDSVAYATHLSFPTEPPFAPGLFRAIERRMMAMPEVPSGVEPLRPLLQVVLAELGLRVSTAQENELAYQCLMVARHVDRVRIADLVLAAGLPLALYGRGWETIERFKPHHRGLVTPGPELRAMYQRHKVILHINTRCNLHPRVLEASACGAFVLGRSDGHLDFDVTGVDRCLKVGSELCLFDGDADLVAKIRRAFADETWRRGFTDRARARVLRDHTYGARAAAMLAALREHLRAHRRAA